MPSIDVTFLGHQGWLLSAGESYSHPLCRPDRALALYRALRDAAAPSTTVRVGR